MLNPIEVFIDTNVFIKMRYDFTNSPLSRLKKYVNIGIVRLVTNNIVVREVETHIKEDVSDESAHLKNAVKKHCFREVVYSDGYETLRRNFKEDNWDEIIISKFHQFLKDTNCIILDNENIKLNELFDDYFSCQPPFEVRAEKKHEFPDAVMIKSIKNYVSNYNNKMIVITDDDGWKAAFESINKIEVIKDIKKTLNKISSEYGENIVDGYIEYLGEQKAKILEDIEDWLYNCDWDCAFEENSTLDVEGIYENQVDDIQLFFDGFEYVDDEEACARFKTIVTADIAYEYDDYTSSIYDKEDNSYYNVVHGNAKEKHRFPVEVRINLSKNDNDYNIEDIEFEDFEISYRTEISSLFEEYQDNDFGE